MSREVVQAHPAGSVFTPTWWTQVVRIGLLIGLAVWTALAFWPRGTDADLDEVVADIRSGDVAEIQVGHESGFGGAFIGPWQERSEDIRVRWRTTPDGDWYTFLTHEQPEYVSPPDLETSPDATPEHSAGSENRDPVLELIDEELDRGSDGEALSTHLDNWRFTPDGLRLGNIWLVATFLVVLGTLIGGPQPRWATKWAWFWLLSLPYGIGVVLLLLLDAPWARFASHQPEPLPHDLQVKRSERDRRMTGGWTFLLVALLGGFA